MYLTERAPSPDIASGEGPSNSSSSICGYPPSIPFLTPEEVLENGKIAEGN